MHQLFTRFRNNANNSPLPTNHTHAPVLILAYQAGPGFYRQIKGFVGDVYSHLQTSLFARIARRNPE